MSDQYGVLERGCDRLGGAAVSVSIFMAVLTFVPFAAAQDEEAAPEPGETRLVLEEIIVTAQKIEQNLQDVPIAVTALDANALEKANVLTAADLHGLVPNLWIVQQSTSPANPSATIRGVNSNVSLTSQDGGVAFYIDGIYLTSNMGSSLEIADIKRVEVLRGPQGTLYGRNSTGGAINFITRGPSGQFGIRQDVTVGDDSLFKVRTRLDLPEWNALSASMTFLRQESDGYVTNLTPGRTVDYSEFTLGSVGRLTTPRKLGGTDIKAFQTALRYAPVDRFTADYRFTLNESENIPKAIQVLGFVDGPGGDFAQFVYSEQPPGTPIFVSSERLGAVSNPYISPEFLDIHAHSLTLSYDFTNELRIRSITGYRDVENFSISDLGGGGGLVDPFGSGAPYTLFTGLNNRDLRSTTSELQFLGNMSSVEWVTGLYYSRVKFPNGGRNSGINYALGLMPEDLDGGVFLPMPPSVPGFVENKAYAVFAQGTYHATDRLDVTLGARNSWDDRGGFSGTTGQSFETEQDHFDWTAILTFHATDRLMTFAKASTGYLSGGVTGPEQTPFDPEEVFQVELGAKADLLGQRLRTNVSAFWSDYKDIQVLDFSTGVVRFVNAAKAEVYGMELEVTALPVERLTLSASYGYTNFDYQEFILGDVDVTDTQREWFRPEHTGSVAAEYGFHPFTWGGQVSLRVDTSYQSKVFFAPKHSDPVFDRASVADPRWLLNARATLADVPLGTGSARLSFWGRNLTDEDELEFAAAVGTTIIGTFMRPRTYGLDLTVEF